MKRLAPLAALLTLLAACASKAPALPAGPEADGSTIGATILQLTS